MNLTHTGRTALVTGASRLIGIGAAICLELARSGANVIFTHYTPYDRDQYGTAQDEPQQLLARLREFTVKSADIEIDLSKPD
jgi:3-oxoacyl-[acyl-carrier protein] reductase